MKPAPAVLRKITETLCIISSVLKALTGIQFFFNFMEKTKIGKMMINNHNTQTEQFIASSTNFHRFALCFSKVNKINTLSM